MSSIMVSVIVPVYNVEPYLKKCLDSLVNQTYKNYEVLLVDDGSTDSSGKMCDAHAEKYSQFKVFHKVNGGQSDARNYAAPYIRGSYVTYVDSDDYVEPNYLECMVDALDGSKADMVTALYWMEYPNRLKAVTAPYDKIIFTPERALEEMCYERKIGTSPWGKLIAVSVIKKFPFPKGKICEDLATIYKMIGESNQVISIGKPLYHYVQRKGSTMHSGWRNSWWDVIEASSQLLEYVDRNYPKAHAAAVHRYFFSVNEFFVRACREKNYGELIMAILPSLRRCWDTLRKDPQVSVPQKLKFGMMTFAPGLYRLCRKFLDLSRK